MTTSEIEQQEEPAQKKPDENQPEISSETIALVRTDNENPDETTPEWVDILGSGSIMKKIIVPGVPESRPERQQKCRIKYDLIYDEKVLESVPNIEVTLGESDVVQGLDVALSLMNVKERCLLKIAPRLAYGSVGLGSTIPPDATVVYDVELLAVEEQEEIENLSMEERKHKGNKKRERGNWWYGRGENSLAIQCYRFALNYLDEAEGGIKFPKEDKSEENGNTEILLHEMLEDRISVYNNMAAAQIKLELYDAALKSLQTVLTCQPNNTKALFRKSKVLREKNDIPAALQCLRKADELCPNNQEVQRELNQLNKLMQKHRDTEKELARRMFKADQPSKQPTARNKVRREKSDIPILIECLQKAQQFSPNNADVSQQSAHMNNLVHKQKHSENELPQLRFRTDSSDKRPPARHRDIC